MSANEEKLTREQIQICMEKFYALDSNSSPDDIKKNSIRISSRI